MRCRSATRTSSDRSRWEFSARGSQCQPRRQSLWGFIATHTKRQGPLPKGMGSVASCRWNIRRQSLLRACTKAPALRRGLMRWSARSPRSGTLSGDCSFGRPLMSTVTLIGIDLGKHSFHLHGQDAAGRMMFRKKCSRQDLFVTGQHTAQHSGDGGLRRRALDGAPHRRTGPPGQAHFPSSCAPSYRATRMTSPMPRRSARRPRARACGS